MKQQLIQKKKQTIYKTTERLNPKRIKEILKVEKQLGLTPENLVAIASREDNPLHDLFEWDDNVAGEQYRLCQARVLINEVKIKIADEEYYAFENVKVSTGNENHTRVYKPIKEILGNKELKQQLITSALKQHLYWEQQNQKYKELSPIIKTARGIRKKWEQKNK